VSANSTGSSAIAFSGDGTHIATAGGRRADGSSAPLPIVIWSANGVLEKEISNSQIRPNTVAFSPDGRAIASLSEENGADLVVFDVATGEQLLHLQNNAALAGAFSFLSNSQIAWGHMSPRSRLRRMRRFSRSVEWMARS
jgi:hypothetical protein